jgi:hypothetical protein
MTSDPQAEPELVRPAQKGYLFSDAGLGSPLAELRAVFEKKLRTAQNLGENEKARAYREAYELARKRLAVSLGQEAEKR